jgi:multicomponent Na+:H+ antiporter subunit E
VSAEQGTGRRPRSRAGARGWPVGRSVAVVWLAGAWVLLWGSVDWSTLLGGLALGVLLVVVVRQPPAPLGLRPHPGRLVVELGRVVADVTLSTFTVAWAAVRTGPRTRAEVVRVPARGASNDVLVIVSCLISISPGSMVVEIDGEREELLVHVLPVQDRERTRTALERNVTRMISALQGGRSR